MPTQSLNRPLVLSALAFAVLLLLMPAGGRAALPIETTQVLVKFAAGVDGVEKKEILAEAGATAEGTVPKLNVSVAEASTSEVAELRAADGVLYVEADSLSEAALLSFSPNDPYWRTSSSLSCADLLDCWPYAKTSLARAWGASTGSSSIVIAVLDSGIASGSAFHPDLAGSTVPGWDFVNNDSDPADDLGHGTQVAGVAAARINNGKGVSGTCGGCAIMPLKVLSAGNLALASHQASAITYAADNGAKVINISLQGSAYSQTVQDAIDYATAQGVLVIAAAGNSASSTFSYPGAYANVIAVGATDTSDSMTSYSNYGSWVDLVAPGNFWSAYYDQSAPTTAQPAGGLYVSSNGTSFSSPFVAGIAGLLLSYKPTLTVSQLRNALLAGSTDPVTNRVATGGNPAATCSPCTASGRLDALDAFTSAGVGYVEPVTPTYTNGLTLSGEARDGQTLSVITGSWTGPPAPSFTYLWQRCSAAGAACASTSVTAATYTLAAADVGSTLRVILTGTNAAGSATTTSSLTSAVVGNAPVNTGAPSISGSAQVGSQLTLTLGIWTGTTPLSSTISWQRCNAAGVACVTIAGATGSTLNLDWPDYQKTFKAIETMGNVSASGVQASSATSVAVSAVAPDDTVAPSLSGSALVGSQLTLATGSWTGTAPLNSVISWERCNELGAACATISAATGSTLSLGWTDYGKTLKATVATSNGAGTKELSSTSAVVSAAAPANPLAPSILGSPAFGQLLTASAGSWTGSDVVLSYQWLHDGIEIGGATLLTYTPAAADFGKALSITVAGTNPADSFTAVSVSTAPVTAAAPAGTATISGAAQVGQTLSAVAGTWTGDGLIVFAYQWLRDGILVAPAAGGQNPSYTLLAADAGSSFTVRVTGTNFVSFTGADSSATVAVIPAPVAPPAPPSGGGGGGVNFKVTASFLNAPPPVIGQQFLYRFAVTGTGVTSNVTLRIEIPAGMEIAQTQANRGGGCQVTGQQIICNLDFMSGGMIGEVTVWANAKAAGTLTATAVAVVRSEEAGNLADNSTSLSLTLTDPTVKPSVSPPKPGNRGGKTTLPTPASVSDTTPQVGQKLVAHVGTITLAGPYTLSYQWQSCKGSRCTSIKGATGRTLTLAAATPGFRLRVVVTIKPRSGKAISKVSKQTAPVKAKKAVTAVKP